MGPPKTRGKFFDYTNYRTIFGTLPLNCAAALAETQAVSFEEIYRRTVEAINWGMAAQAMDD